jgi:hypothetical protein
MEKRIVHISEENIFYQVLEKKKVSDIIDELKEKWESLNFSKKVYFEKRRSKILGKGSILFMRAIKPKQ